MKELYEIERELTRLRLLEPQLLKRITVLEQKVKYWKEAYEESEHYRESERQT